MAAGVPAFTLSDRLAKARSTAGISVQEMANRLGLSRTTISNYEGARTRAPRAVVILYSQLCDVPLWWLLDDPVTGSDQVDGAVTIQYPGVFGLMVPSLVAA